MGQAYQGIPQSKGLGNCCPQKPALRLTAWPHTPTRTPASLSTRASHMQSVELCPRPTESELQQGAQKLWFMALQVLCCH